MRGRLYWLVTITVVLGLTIGFSWPAASPITVRISGATPVVSPEPIADCGAHAVPGRIVAVVNEVTARLTDQGFDPAAVQATSGHDLTITLINVGSRPHTYVVDAFEIKVDLLPGAREQVVVSPGGRGDAVTYVVTSDAPGDDCFQGKLIFYV